MKVRIAAAAFALALWAPVEALAGCCGCAWSASRTYSQVTIDRVNQRIDEMERAIVETMELQTAQLSGYIAQSTRAVTSSLDTQTKLLAQIAREEEETRSKLARMPTGSGCRTVTGMTGLAVGREVEERAVRETARRETGRVGGDKSAVERAGAGADAEARYGLWLTTHCSAERLEAGSNVCSGSPERHDADIRAGSLFDVGTFRSDEERVAAVELGRNLAAPVVADRLPLGAVDTEQDRRIAMLARGADARSALASDWFARSRAAREPAAALGVWAAAMAPGSSGSDRISRHELMEILASRRFEDPAWAVGLQGMGTDNLLREIALMQAASLMLDWQRYLMAERRGAMEAASLGAVVEEMRRLPGLADPLTVRN